MAWINKRRFFLLGTIVAATVLFGETRTVAAAAKAYLINVHAEVTVLDTDADAVVGRSRLFGMGRFIGERGHIVAAPADGLLFAVHDQDGLRVAVFDLRTLTLKRDLGLLSSVTPKVLVPPVGPHFFVAWRQPDPGGGPGQDLLSRYDKTTLTKVGDVAGFPFDQLGDRHVFSKDGTRLYARTHGPSLTIRVFDTATMQLLSTVDTAPIYAPNLFARGILNVQGDRALLVENAKAARLDPNRLSLFTIRLPDGVRTPKVVTGLDGESTLTPPGDKIVFEETQTVYGPGGAYVDSVQSLGRLHVYDVDTGTKLGQVAFSVTGNGEIVGVRPSGDKVYFDAGLPGAKESTLTSLSLSTYTTVRVIKVPGFRFMVFVDP